MSGKDSSAPDKDSSEVDRYEVFGENEDALLSAVVANINRNNRALYNLLWVYRLLRSIAREVNQPPCEGTVLEIGTSPEPGLPFISLLDGAEHFIATNIQEVSNFLPEAYVKLVYLIMSGLLPIHGNRLDEVVQWVEKGTSRIGVLRENVFTNLSPCPIENISLPDGSVDVGFTFSVLEHVKDPHAVLRNMFRMARPGGWNYHTIDLRDHTNFDRPLDFLALEELEYVNGTENRLRASEWLHLFQHSGFEIRMVRYMDSLPSLTKGGSTDLAHLALQPLTSLYPWTRLDNVRPWVTPGQRESFVAPYNRMDPKDLSVISLCIACRKPQ